MLDYKKYINQWQREHLVGHQEKESVYRVSEWECVLILVEELSKVEEKGAEIELLFE